MHSLPGSRGVTGVPGLVLVKVDVAAAAAEVVWVVGVGEYETYERYEGLNCIMAKLSYEEGNCPIDLTYPLTKSMC